LLSDLHRTREGERVRFRVISGEPSDPEGWLRETLALNLEKIEARIGTRLVRSGGVISRPLGCGAFGCVFRLEDGRVFKITSDDSEGAYSLWIYRLQQAKARTKVGPVLAVTARVDDVFRFPRRKRVDGQLAVIYGIVREQVGSASHAIPRPLRKGVDLYTDGWDTFGTSDALDPAEKGARFLGVAIARLGLEKIKSAGIEGRRLYEFLVYAWQRGIPIMDIHTYNLARRITSGPGGAHAGQIVLFDYGGSTSCRISHGEDDARKRFHRPVPVDLKVYENEVPVL
jgi:hypothetical protein